MNIWRWFNLANQSFWVIGGFYVGKCYCILHALGNKKENLVVFNLADFCNSPNCKNKFYAKFSSYTAYQRWHHYVHSLATTWSSVCWLPRTQPLPTAIASWDSCQRTTSIMFTSILYTISINYHITQTLWF